MSKRPFQPMALELVEPVIWIVSGVGIGGAIAVGKFVLAVVVGLLGLSLALRLRRKIHALRRPRNPPQ